MVVFAGEMFSYCQFHILFDDGCIMFIHPSTYVSRCLANVMLAKKKIHVVMWVVFQRYHETLMHENSTIYS